MHPMQTHAWRNVTANAAQPPGLSNQSLVQKW